MMDLRKYVWKTGLLLLAFAAAAPAAVITSITTTADENPEDDSAVLTTMTVGATFYTTFTPGTTVWNASNVVTTGSYFRGEAANSADPGSRVEAFRDRDLTTGLFNPGALKMMLTGSPTSLVYVFGVQDGIGTVTALDASGNAISNPLNVSYVQNLLTIRPTNNGAPLNQNRTIGGSVFTPAEFTYIDGKTSASFGGFTYGGSNFDPVDFGIATVPEPTTAALAAIAAIALTARRRRVA